MQKIIEDLEILRQYTGNAQIDKLNELKSDLLKEVLEYTYDTHRKYKIDEGKYNKVSVFTGEKQPLTVEYWNKFKSLLDKLSEMKSAKDDVVCFVKSGIQNCEESKFLEQVLFKDLRLGMNIKKFQQVWPTFLVEPQVQLAQKFEGVKYPYSMYSRKLDGLRCYYLDGIPVSRTNKAHKPAPLSHITKQLNEQLLTCKDWVFDGEIIYLNPDGTEDFTKAISLARSDNRTKDCDNLYFCIFDIIRKENFINKIPDVPFKDAYTRLKATLGIIEEKRDWFTTTLPNVVILKQVEESGLAELQENRFKYGYEGIMIRNGDSPYEYKRSGNIRKIKEMQDTEVKLLDMEEGTGKFEGTLGAFIADYNGFPLKIGSGFSDEQREEYWNNKDKYIGQYVKVKYFEKTTNQQGGESLRFPIFLCFRNMETMEEFTKL